MRPDYIDPMFHKKVIGTPSRNLDTFFGGKEMTRYLFARQAGKAEISVMEGVMGYYDGVAGFTTEASSYDLADVTDTPVIFVINTRGMSLSVIPFLKGFLEYRENSHLKGVILNQTSASMYPELKARIEEELPIRVYGYVPKVTDCVIESRHLGLVTPGEIEGLKERLQKLSEILEKTLDIDGILELAASAPELSGCEMPESLAAILTREKGKMPVRIGVAKDEAFCFYYEDNLDLLRELGAEIVEFSPIHDRKLPESIQGMLIGGGYPELYAGELSENVEMLESIRSAVKAGLPTLAECGGFMYLHNSMEDMEGRSWPMVGVIDALVYRTEKLGRFGYIHLTANREQIFGPPEQKSADMNFTILTAQKTEMRSTHRNPGGRETGTASSPENIWQQDFRICIIMQIPSLRQILWRPAGGINDIRRDNQTDQTSG
ncbi:MAG: cobyrinate a,c-diamide synthase [Eubacterium sp.]